MPSSERSRAAPSGAGLDARLDAFDHFAVGLVRLEPYPLEEVRRTVEGFCSELERHLRESRRRGVVTPRDARAEELLRSEHDRFPASVEELRALLDVVVHDDHGGHRQALGQYGRILVEALRAHRADEALPSEGSSRATPFPPPLPARGNHN